MRGTGRVRRFTDNDRPWGRDYTEVTKDLVKIGRRARLFRSPDDDLWAEIGSEVYRVDNGPFLEWLGKTYFDEHGEPPSKHCLSGALETLKGFARLGGDVRPVSIRTAECEGEIFIHLANREGEVIKISKNPWEVTTNAPVAFFRPRGTQALPRPVRGGTLLELRSFFPHLDDFCWSLLIIWLLNALRPRGPHPILSVGPDGGLLLIKLLSRLIDPRSNSLRGAPKDLRDVTASVANSWLVSFAELVKLSSGSIGELSRAARGGGFSGRRNYTDFEEFGFQATRLIAFMSRELLAPYRDDFAELTFRVEPSEGEEPLIDEVGEAFEKALPRILGALFDATASCLRNIDKQTFDDGSVLSPCLRWALACAEDCGLDADQLKEAFFENQFRTQRALAEASGMLGPLRSLMSEKKAYFRVTPTQLFKALRPIYDDTCEDREARPFPKIPGQLSRVLFKLRKTFRYQGIFINRGRTPDHDARFIEIANYDVQALNDLDEVRGFREVNWDLIPDLLPSDDDGHDDNHGSAINTQD
jgi:hypothetical protein